jgi:hypothetical protein
MARRKLQKTLADYLAIGVTPILIMLLVGSLVFFLQELFFEGGRFESRSRWILFWFVVGSVLTARIAIESGRALASAYTAGLCIAVGLAIFKFIPNNPLVPLVCLGIIWWCTDKLTWDCTLIDDSEDASGEGLLQVAGVADEAELPAKEDADTDSKDQSSLEESESPAPDERVPLWKRLFSNKSEREGKPHSPGLWVVYFSLAASPIFGFGQAAISSSDTESRDFAFHCLVVYVGAGLGLLMLTSFLGLRRYLRQRNLQMPTAMAATWIGFGTTIVIGILVTCLLLPRPDGEYDLTDWIDRASESIQKASDVAFLDDDGGGEGDGERSGEADQDAKQGAAQNKDPNQKGKPGGKKGDNPDAQPGQEKGENGKNTGDKDEGNKDGKSNTEKQSGEKQSGEKQSGEKQSGEKQSGEKQSGEKQSGEKQSGEKQSGEKQSGEKQSGEKQSGEKQSGEKQSGEKQSNGDQKKQDADPNGDQQQENDKDKEQDKKKENGGGGDDNNDAEKKDGEQGADPDSEDDSSDSSSESASDTMSSVFKSIGTLFKFIVYGILICIGLFFLWKNWAAVCNFFARLWREFLSLFGRKPKDEVEDSAETEEEPVAPPRPFSAFADPFRTGAAHQVSASELVRYTFDALQAWAFENNCGRSPSQTPMEFGNRLQSRKLSFGTEANEVSQLYARVAYASHRPTDSNIRVLEQLWRKLKA